LFSTFLDEFEKVSQFYSHAPTLEGVEKSAREVRPETEARRVIVDILCGQNRSFGCDAATEGNLERLAAGAVAVVTGQQVGLFTGPSYSFYKAIGAIALARNLADAGVGAVPVFWLASEDHDLEEVCHCHLLDARGNNHALEMHHGEEVRNRSVGAVQLGEAIREVAARASALLDGPFAAEVAQALEQCYVPGETYGSAFAKLMTKLLPGQGLIFLEPLDPRLQALAAPVYRRALEESGELTRELQDRGNALESAGYHAQVKVTGRSTLLFINVDGQRLALRRRGNEFTAGTATFGLSELRDVLEKQPERFTGNVLLRPVVQDTLLPTAAYLGGPAEIAYFAQAEVIYRRLLCRMPTVLPRPGFTLVEPRVQRLLRKYRLELRDFSAGRQKLRAKMENAFLPKRLAARFDRGERTLRATLEKLHEPVGQVDQTLLGAMENAEKKMLYQFGKLRARAARAEAFRAGVIDRHERLLRDALFPHHGLQERSLCLLPFLARHGTALVEELVRRAWSSDPGQHQVLFL
jgi:bacillithiol biosynthesis cysteine-adding enzyme BshC